MSKINYSLDNPVLFRFLFFAFLAIVPIITSMVYAFDSLYVFIIIFLGLGFSNKSKWILLLTCAFVVIMRTIIQGEFENPTAVFIRLFIYLTVTFISSELTKHYHETKHHKTELILALSKSLDSRDSYTADHSENVANYALKIACEMKLSKKECEDIYIGGLLHDIGKIGVPESILMKPSRLTDDEFEYIKLHPAVGYETIKHISSFRKNGVLEMVLHHHERFDGKGYPHGLKGEEIPLFARILTVADSYDAMTTKRIYRDIMDFESVVKEITDNKDKQFDSKIADVFLGILLRDGLH